MKRKTVDISGMDPSRSRFGYEWGCQVLMFRALNWLKNNAESKNPKFHGYKNITGVMVADNPDAKEMEEFALNHDKIREMGATGAMVQYSFTHALQRHRKGENGYFKEFENDPKRIFEFDEDEAFPEKKEKP